jgi:hypothetical protein
VAMIVHRDGPDRCPSAKPKLGKRIRQLLRSSFAPCIVVPKDTAMRLARNDFRVAKLPGSVLNHVANQQRSIHHESGLQHESIMLCFGTARVRF